jgi:hypothetical protein
VLNFAAGQTRSNNAVIRLSDGAPRSFDLTGVLASPGAVHAIVDVVGWFE